MAFSTFLTRAINQHHRQFENVFTTPKQTLSPVTTPPAPSSPALRDTTSRLYSAILDSRVNGITYTWPFASRLFTQHSTVKECHAGGLVPLYAGMMSCYVGVLHPLIC